MSQRRDETAEEYRARRRSEEKRRRSDPVANERIKASARARYAAGGRDRQRRYYEQMRGERFFQWRARLWSGRWRVRVTEAELLDLWMSQQGRCALSDRALGPDAHLDHVIPVARGGSHGVENLRWLDPLVNVARGAMSDESFIALCRSVAERAA